MKKYLLSFGLIIVFAFYSLQSSTKNPTSQAASIPASPTTITVTPPIATQPIQKPAATIVKAKKAAIRNIIKPTVVRRNDDEGDNGGENEDGNFTNQNVSQSTTGTTPPTTNQPSAVATAPAPVPTPASIPQPTQTPAPTPASTPAPNPTPSPTTTNSGQYKNGTYTGHVVDAYYGNIQVSATIQGGKLTDVQFLQYPSDRGTSIRINTNAMPILKSEAIQAQSAVVNGVSGASETSSAFKTSLSTALAMAVN